MAKTSSYPSVDDQTKFTPAERTKFLETAMCLATGKKTDAGSKLTANIPFDTIVPTKLSQLTDDITQQTVTNDTRPVSGAAVTTALASFGGFEVTTLSSGVPAVNNPNTKTIYLAKEGNDPQKDSYSEWICTDTTTNPVTWEKIGDVEVDLANYYTKSDVYNKTEVDNKIPTVPVTDVTVDGTSVVSNGTAAITTPTFTQQNADWNASTGVTAILNKPAIPFARTYACFEGGTTTSSGVFVLTGTTEINTGLNTDHIAVSNNAFVVPAAGIYNITVAINISNTQPSTVVDSMYYGVKRVVSGGTDVELGTHYFVIDHINPAQQDQHMHLTVALQANDVVTPFVKNVDPNVTSWTSFVTKLGYMSFEKIAPIPQSN